jgi:DNA-binding CsgD family transcriptional regulator
VIATDPLIGRVDELAVIDRFLERIEGGAHALFIEGEPGIGKTRLWQESVDRAGERGHRVLSARPGGAEVQLAFAGLSDLLHDALDDVLPALPPPQRRALEVALLLTDADGKPPDQRAVSAAFLGALRALAIESPVVVAIDDLQWVDRASAFVLAFVARRLDSAPVGLLATVRVSPDVTAPADVAEAIAAQLTRLPLGSMSISAVYELCRTRLDFPLRRPVLLRVHETSGGRPFLALELARALRNADHEVAPAEPLPVPKDLRELLLARLTRLSESTRETLLYAAALSQPTLELLGRAIAQHALEDVRQAADAGIAELDGSRVRFTHPLLASVHYESAPPSQRRTAHGRLAEVTVDREERARHLALASDGPDEQVASALDEAVAAAEARGAVPAAAELAVKAVLLTPEANGERLHRRRLEAARLEFAAGDRDTARGLLEEALASAHPGDQRAETLLELGMISSWEELGAGLALLREAAAEPTSDARLRTSILIRLAPREGYSGAGYDRAIQIAQEAVGLAEGGHDDAVLANALATLGYVELLRGRAFPHAVMQRAEMLEAALGLTVDGPTELYAEMLACCYEHAAACERLERLVALGREIGDTGVCRPLFRLAYSEWDRGNWDRAWSLGLEAQEIAAQSGRETTAPLGEVVLALVEALRGDIEAGRARALAALEATDRAGRHSGGPRGALALIELSRERYGDAYELMEPYYERVEGRGAELPGTEDSNAVEALAGLGRLDEARTRLEPLESYARRLGQPWALAAAARSRGYIAAEAGDLASAETELEEAVATGAKAELPLELARSLLAFGSVRRRRGEKRAAREALTRSLEIFERLGTPIWAARARRELRRIGGRRSPTTGLSETERQIVELVVAGRTNKEVASALHLSPKTVEWNLSRVYRKLGVRSRTQLAALLRTPDSSA